jgi:hypothetical protein
MIGFQVENEAERNMSKNVSFRDYDIKYEDGKYIASGNNEHWESSDGVSWEQTKGLSKSQESIMEICDSIKDLLLYKNEKYGDSALRPNNIFYKGDSTNSIKIRLDDKIGRIKNCEQTRINDVADVIGYCILLLISIGACEEDIERLKD